MENVNLNEKNKAVYATPRVWQVIITIFFIAVFGGLFLPRTVFDYELDYTYMYGRILPDPTIFRYAIADLVSKYLLIAAFAAMVAGAIFIWLNKPKCSMICACVNLIPLLSAIITIKTEHLMTNLSLYVVIALEPVLIFFCVIAIVKTVKLDELVKQHELIVERVSDAEELKKYRELLDAGVLTQEEFDDKKKQILKG
ncbi:MAG: SHOCT domain-containing protein [Clostridiales bacterium]|nr:SHOCT domain-containing protein [Clostridiales bacterium]